MTHKCCWLLSVAWMIGSTSPALAGEPAELARARATYTQGEKHLKANRLTEARDAFVEVLNVIKVPTVALKLGQTYEMLGEFLRAAQFYTLATELRDDTSWKDNAKQRKAQEDAQAALVTLNARIPTLTIDLLGDTSNIADLTLDGEALSTDATATPQLLNPGDHAVVMTMKDGRSVKRTVTLAESDHKTVSLDLANAIASTPAIPNPEKPSPPLAPLAVVSPPQGHVAPVKAHNSKQLPNHTQRRVAYASLGVGAAGLALGTTAGIVAWVKYGNMKPKCQNDRGCTGEIFDQYDSSYDTWRHVSTVSFIAAGVGAALGVTLLLVRPAKESHPQVSLMMNPSTLSVNGRFW